MTWKDSEMEVSPREIRWGLNKEEDKNRTKLKAVIASDREWAQFSRNAVLVLMQMNIHAGTPTMSNFSTSHTQTSSSSFYHYSYSLLRPLCSKRNSDQESNPNGGESNGGKFSTDWDKAWTKFRKQGTKKKKKKSVFSGFSPNKYVTWNPTRSNYPLSEEVDPIKRTERSNLALWTSPRFTLFGAVVIVSFLLLYTILAIPR